MSHKFESPLVESYKFVNPGDLIEGCISIIDSTMIDDRMVPFVELLDKDDKQIQVLMSSYALHEVWNSPDISEDGYLVLRYDGESQTIMRAQNKAKLFSVCYYAPGDWEMGADGEIEGKPTRLRKAKNNRSAAKAEPLTLTNPDELPFDVSDHVDIPAEEPKKEEPKKSTKRGRKSS